MMGQPNPKLAESAAALPAGPGVYMFRSGAGTILYIGKAKSLRQRTRSYFRPGSAHSPRIDRMLAEAVGLEVIVTDSEIEALILENQLIKLEKPRYNVLLRDDKNYPYLKLTWQDRFPRAVMVRSAFPDGQLYFGPYLPARTARRSLKAIARLFQVATCNEKLDGSRPRPCLYFHMNQCLGPCAGLITQVEYREAVRQARMFLEGGNRELRVDLAKKMRSASDREDFEAAARYRDLLRIVKKQSERVGLRGIGLVDQDFFSFHRSGTDALLLVFVLRNGAVRSRREFRFSDLDLPDEEFLASAICQYYALGNAIPARIFTPIPVQDGDWIARWLTEKNGRTVKLSTPTRGPRKMFLATLERNARLGFQTSIEAVPDGARILEQLRERMQLDAIPHRIEGIDISHTGGSLTVASVVVWEGGDPVRRAFRRMRMKSVSGPDDYAAMAEAVGRRYSRLIREDEPLPDLLLLDGGKGQLAAAQRGLRENGIPPIPIAALAKREEEVFLPGRADPIPLDRHDPVLHLIQRIRDEAHRYAHAYHRRLRTRSLLRTELQEIAGIGPARAKRLLRRFGSLQGVSRAGEEALEQEVGKALAARIRNHFPGRKS